jgi:hypothetical protein
MKTLLIMTMVATSVTAMAQKGNWYVGGVVGYVSHTSEPAAGSKFMESSWAFGPEVGTFLKDDIQLGFVLGLGGFSRKVNNIRSMTSTNFSPTAYVRKFFKVTDNLSTFAGFYVNYSTGTTTDHTITPSLDQTQSGVGVRLGIGIAYALSPRFTAVGQYGLMGYQTLTSKQAGATTGTDSSFNFGVNTVGSGTLSQGNGSGAVFNIGLYYTFKKL